MTWQLAGLDTGFSSFVTPLLVMLPGGRAIIPAYPRADFYVTGETLSMDAAMTWPSVSFHAAVAKEILA